MTFKNSLFSDSDLYLHGEGNLNKAYEQFGAHYDAKKGGTYFSVWAPNAKSVRLMGDFSNWQDDKHSLLPMGSSGIWSNFFKDVKEGAVYKYKIETQGGRWLDKADPYAFYAEKRPATSSIVFNIEKFKWTDDSYMQSRRKKDPVAGPVCIYEVHPGSWKRGDNNSLLNYRQLASDLIPYCKYMGFTHIELMGISEHPLDQSWGYQVTGYFSPTSRFGTPEDFAYFVNEAHKADIGIILDWVPAHFPKDDHGLSNFDGSALYEHAHPFQGEHKDWGTKIFNTGRNEVRNFLISNALFWIDKYHIDGLRVDAVASMLYLDYSREEGEWIPNQFGGRENLENLHFLKQFNEVIFGEDPGLLSIAEESTAWPGVTQPTYAGGLGFNLKWNMGWMNDTLEFFKEDPIHRAYHINDLTFSLIYAFSEKFALVLSHDEVVHGKASLINKMPGDDWQKFANLRMLFCLMYFHPGKKTLFMGSEIAPWEEWNVDNSLPWHLTEYDRHKSMQNMVRDLNKLIKAEEALYLLDFSDNGFRWIDFSDTQNTVVAFRRRKTHDENNTDGEILLVFNFTPVVREGYRIGVPQKKVYNELFNSDSFIYGGTNIGNAGAVSSEEITSHGFNNSISITIPPLAVVAFK